MDTELSFTADKVTVQGESWKAPAAILEAVQLENMIVLLLDWEALGKDTAGQVYNLRAYSVTGQELWVAEHPTNATNDCYTTINSIVPFEVYNFAGFICVINLANGRLIRSVFTK